MLYIHIWIYIYIYICIKHNTISYNIIWYIFYIYIYINIYPPPCPKHDMAWELIRARRVQRFQCPMINDSNDPMINDAMDGWSFTNIRAARPSGRPPSWLWYHFFRFQHRIKNLIPLESHKIHPTRPNTLPKLSPRAPQNGLNAFKIASYPPTPETNACIQPNRANRNHVWRCLRNISCKKTFQVQTLCHSKWCTMCCTMTKSLTLHDKQTSCECHEFWSLSLSLSGFTSLHGHKRDNAVAQAKDGTLAAMRSRPLLASTASALLMLTIFEALGLSVPRWKRLYLWRQLQLQAAKRGSTKYYLMKNEQGGPEVSEEVQERARQRAYFMFLDGSHDEVSNYYHALQTEMSLYRENAQWHGMITPNDHALVVSWFVVLLSEVPWFIQRWQNRCKCGEMGSPANAGQAKSARVRRLGIRVGT